MKQDPHLLDDYIKHILAAIERIQRYCADANELAFLENDMLQDAVIRVLHIFNQHTGRIVISNLTLAKL